MVRLAEAAPAFVQMTNRIFYCTLATVTAAGEPAPGWCTRCWTWDGRTLVGWVGSLVTPMKRAHLERTPYVSCCYWDGVEAYDDCVAEYRAELLLDDASQIAGWERFRNTPPPPGYDPALLPQWQDGVHLAPLRRAAPGPWHVRIFPVSSPAPAEPPAGFSPGRRAQGPGAGDTVGR